MIEQLETIEVNTGVYKSLCEVAEIQPIAKTIDLSSFGSPQALAEKSLDERLQAGLQVFIDMVAGDTSRLEKIDKYAIDYYIAKIDQVINQQLDEILHHEKFQQLESSWLGLRYLVDRTDFRANTKIEILDADKESLRQDFLEASETLQSGLYQHVYVQEYDTPGGEPISSIVANYEFNSAAPDVAMLREISRVASVTHCPFIAAIGPEFFGKKTVDEVANIQDLSIYMERAEFIKWNSFRETDDARYVGLTLPRFLLRLPYGDQNPVTSFYYAENVADIDHKKFLWGNSAFAFATNLTRSFKDYGWTVNIRGPEAGGKIENLLLHQYDVGRGMQTKIPSETLIPETRELEFANLGFIPLSYYKNSDFACFFSANSIQKPALYSTSEATANSRINSRLPYIYLSSRLGHYLKVLQRENIGAAKNRAELEMELNTWLQTLVTKMNNPGPELAALHPLREASAEVIPYPDNPGFYRVNLYAVPHFQIEGIDVRLSLVAQMPAKKTG